MTQAAIRLLRTSLQFSSLWYVALNTRWTISKKLIAVWSNCRRTWFFCFLWPTDFVVLLWLELSGKILFHFMIVVEDFNDFAIIDKKLSPRITATLRHTYSCDFVSCSHYPDFIFFVWRCIMSYRDFSIRRFNSSSSYSQIYALLVV